MPAGDTNSDGDWDAADAIAVAGGYDVRKDADLDGTVDSNDVAHANSITGGYQTLGFAVLSSAAIGATRGYAGYQALPELARTMWHVRHRVLDSELGRWTRRDPLGYVDGMGVYEYVAGMATVSWDARGLMRGPCPGRRCGDDPPDLHGPPCYACPAGVGRQVENPPLDGCDRCCTAACNAEPNAGGVTACCGTTPTNCWCAENNRKLSSDPCVLRQLERCFRVHEARHLGDIDCSHVAPCGLRDPASPGGLPWKRDDPCTAFCSECAAYNASVGCFMAMRCAECANYIECERVRLGLLDVHQTLRDESCDLCALCRRSDIPLPQAARVQ